MSEKMSESVPETALPYVPLITPSPGSNWALFTTDPILREIASELPGWADLEAKIRDVDAAISANRVEYPSSITAAYEVVAGADILERGKSLVESRNRASVQEAIDEISAHVRIVISEQAVSLIGSAIDQIAGELTRRLTLVVDEATDVAGRLIGVRTPDDIVRRPEAAGDFADFARLVGRFNQLRSAGNTIATATNPDPMTTADMRWPESNLYADYTMAWPDFYLKEGLVITDEYGAYMGSLEPSQPPWIGFSPSQTLRNICDRSLPVWVPSPRQLARRQDQIESDGRLRIQKRFDSELARRRKELGSANSPGLEVHESPYSRPEPRWNQPTASR